MRTGFRVRSCTPLLVLLLLAASATAATAATKRLKPLDFVPADSSVNSVRTPVSVAGSTVTVTYSAPLGIPVGATLTGIRLYSSGAAAPRGVTVYRFAYPSVTDAIAGASSNAPVPSLVTPALTNGSVHPDPGIRVISSDYLYFVRLSCSSGTAIWAVDVDYTP